MFSTTADETNVSCVSGLELCLDFANHPLDDVLEVGVLDYELGQCWQLAGVSTLTRSCWRLNPVLQVPETSASGPGLSEIGFLIGGRS